MVSSQEDLLEMAINWTKSPIIKRKVGVAPRL